MKHAFRASSSLAALLTLASASAQSANTLNEGIWDDNWGGGYSVWLPTMIGLAVAVGLVVWMARKQKK